MAFSEDMSVFVHADAPGIFEAQWTPAGGSATTVYGYFNTPSAQIELGAVGVSVIRPAFECLAADVAGAAAGDALVVGGSSWTIASEPEKLDDGAFVRLPLQAV